MEDAAEDFSAKISFNVEGERRIEAFMEFLGIEASAISVASDDEGRQWIEMDIKSIHDFSISSDEILKKAGELTGFHLSELNIEKRPTYYRLVMSNGENYDAVYSISSKKKENEEVCGDTAEIFKTAHGKLVMLLSDGMGSGARAAIDSNLATKVVKKIMNSGFDYSVALRTMDGALRLQHDDERVTTLDLSIIDLYTGEGEFVKAGAPPTYIKREDKIYKIENNSLPAGIMDTIDFRSKKMVLRKDDVIVMISDGLLTQEDDGLIVKTINNYSEEEMKQLSSKILKNR